jgi:alcohol dehydrogenase, propanol-preferring
VSMDSVLTPWRALRATSWIKPGERVRVVGAGGLGLDAAQIALAASDHVAVADSNEQARLAGIGLGAAAAVSPTVPAPPAEWAPRGADVVVDTSDASGEFEGVRARVPVPCPGERLIVLGDALGVEHGCDLPRPAIEELSIMAARPSEAAVEAPDAVARREIRAIVSETVALDDVNDALCRLGRGQIVGRAVVAIA